MKNENMTFRREYLEQMSSEQLNEILQEQLRRELPDGDVVRLVLGMLKERDRSKPVEMHGGAEEAWSQYLARTRHVSAAPVRKHHLLLKIASVVLVLCSLFLIVPQTVEAEGLFDRIARWTDSVFELLSGIGADSDEEYVFKTDHPGLQQVYDAVTELGITQPVVPMWLPEGYVITQCEIVDNDYKSYLTAWFSDGEGNVVFELHVYGENKSSAYFKDEKLVEKHELNGTIYNIMRNDDMWVVVWTADNLECSIAIDCQEDTLNKILMSIYNMEDE